MYKNIETANVALAERFDVMSLPTEFYENPYPIYHALRRYAPVHKMSSGTWFLTRHNDLTEIYKEPTLFSSDKTVDFRKTMGTTALYEHHTASLVFNDPPRHSRVRKRLAPAFTPRALRTLTKRVEAVVDQTIDVVGAMGEFDLLHDFAMKLPIELIGDMLGVPSNDRHKLSPWAVEILGGLEADLNTEKLQRGATAVDEFKEYLGWLIAERKTNSATNDTGEVLSQLIGPDKDGAELSELELLHNCIFLLNAGHETTANTITNGIDVLLRFPHELDRLRSAPDMIVSATEEILRFESAVQLNNRKLTADAVVGGIQMDEGDYLWLAIGAANRDPQKFMKPDEFDIGRSPNRHFAFGTGIHACAGMSLARMEVQIAINKLIQRFGSIEQKGRSMRQQRARFRGFDKYFVCVST